MPFKRPTLTEIDERIRNDIAGRMQIGPNTPQTASLLRRSVVRVLSRVYAGACHALYGFLAWLATQRFVHSMEAEFLDAEGLTYDLPRKPAETASGTALATGLAGSVIPAGAVCKRDDGAEYAVTADATIGADGTAQVTLQAVVAGSAGNAAAGIALSWTSPIAGLQNGLTVADIRGGTDSESDEDYRERILDRKREPPHGGNAHDYEQWALQVPGITRAWCMPLWMGYGTVGVMIARDNDVDIIPTEEQCREVWNYIEPLRPVTAEVYVFAPVKQPVDVTVKISPDSEVAREAVELELRDFIDREGGPSAVLRVSRISEAISAAVGEHHHYLLEPMNDVTVAANAIPVLGQLVFVEGG
jgi:uncharacterized phage protein gp47/JayE